MMTGPADFDFLYVLVGEHEIPLTNRGNGMAENIAPCSDGSYLRIAVEVVHQYQCPSFRHGARYAPCDCGARDLYDRVALWADKKEA